MPTLPGGGALPPCRGTKNNRGPSHGGKKLYIFQIGGPSHRGKNYTFFKLQRCNRFDKLTSVGYTVRMTIERALVIAILVILVVFLAIKLL